VDARISWQFDVGEEIVHELHSAMIDLAEAEEGILRAVRQLERMAGRGMPIDAFAERVRRSFRRTSDVFERLDEVKKAMRQANETFNNVNQHMLEYISGLETVQQDAYVPQHLYDAPEPFAVLHLSDRYPFPFGLLSALDTQAYNSPAPIEMGSDLPYVVKAMPLALSRYER